MKRKAFQPGSPELETRLLLSLTEAPPVQTAEVSTTSAPATTDTDAPPPEGTMMMTTVSDRSGMTPAVAISNSVKGTYFAAEDNRAADAPLRVKVVGAGRVNGVGASALTGNLSLGGFRVAGSNDVTGTLTLTNARGQVKLKLAGTGGFADVPNGTFTTTVTTVKGTGAYRGFQRSGTVTFQFGANTIQAIKAPGPIGGKATITLNLAPLVK